MIGSPITGMASDHFGRRTILLLCLLLSSVLSILMLFINDVFAVITIRFIVGFFISVSFFIFILSFNSKILYLQGKHPNLQSITHLTVALSNEALLVKAKINVNSYLIYVLCRLEPLCSC